MKIVQFENGTYGIRRRIVTGYEFFDFNNNYWWSTHGNYSGHIKDCQVKDLEVMYNVIDRGSTVRVSVETQEIQKVFKYLVFLIKKKFKLG